MIKINVKKDTITIEGHALFDDYGKDIVCASVSSIAITSINAIVRLDSEALTVVQDEGFIEVKINKRNDVIDVLLENMISLFKELENQYKKNIKIYE